MNNLVDRLHSEEVRIRDVYARRAGYAKRYQHFNPAHLLTVQCLEAELLNLLHRVDRQQLENRRILDVGCGEGYWLRRLLDWGARPENVVGVDLLQDALAKARLLLPESARLICANAASTQFENGSFDLILVFTVFTSILDTVIQTQVAHEVLRVLKPDGIVIWWDFRINNPRNADVRGIGKRELVALFSDCEIDLRRVTLAPPISRVIAPRSFMAAQILSSIPILCTHYLGAIRRRMRAGF